MKGLNHNLRMAAVLLALHAASGCANLYCQRQCDWQPAYARTDQAARYESGVIPAVAPAPPATVLDPERTPRPVGLGEVLAVALHNAGTAPLGSPRDLALLNVHAAYWDLYTAYGNLYVNDQGLQQTHSTWTIGKEHLGQGKIDDGQLAQILAQYEQFRGDRLHALGRVLEAERKLRNLAGLTAEDGQRLVPIDTPTTTPMQPDWNAAVATALHRRSALARTLPAQQNLMLRNDGQKAIHFLAQQYSQVIESAKAMDIRRRQRVAQGEQFEARFRKYTEGVKDSPLEFLLDAQRQWMASLHQEYQAVADYNIALASWEFANGTMLQSCHMRIAKGPPSDGDAALHEASAERRPADPMQRQGLTSMESPWPENAVPSLADLDAASEEQESPRPGLPAMRIAVPSPATLADPVLPVLRDVIAPRRPTLGGPIIPRPPTPVAAPDSRPNGD